MFLGVALGMAWSRADGGRASPDNEVQGSITSSTSEPDSTRQTVETPSISGLDRPSVAPPTGPSRSYVVAGVHVNEGADSNPSGTLGGSSEFSSTTGVWGSVGLVKLRRRFETFIDYVAGGTFYSGYNGSGNDQHLQQLSADQRVLWRRGRLTLRDSFSKLVGGNFGMRVFGGTNAQNLRFAAVGTGIPASTGASDFFGASQLGDRGQESYLTNVAEADVTEALTPRSAVSFAGAYSFTDYSGIGINSRQTSVQGGYNYQLDRRNAIGVLYGFRIFQFPLSYIGNVTANSAQLVYQHRVSGRMDLVLGAGPELARVHDVIRGNTQEINATVNAALRYRLKKASLDISYRRLVTSGSGFFAGGNSDVVRFSVARDIFRSWQTAFDAGYARIRSLQPSSNRVGEEAYQYGFAGVAIRRRFGRRFGTSASYEFSDGQLNSVCSSSPSCPGSVGRRHIALIGFDWYIRPILLE